MLAGVKGLAYEPEVPVKVREWIIPALASPDLVMLLTRMHEIAKREGFEIEVSRKANVGYIDGCQSVQTECLTDIPSRKN